MMQKNSMNGNDDSSDSYVIFKVSIVQILKYIDWFWCQIKTQAMTYVEECSQYVINGDNKEEICKDITLKDL